MRFNPLRLVLAIVWLALLAQAANPLYIGIQLVRRPAQVRAQTYPARLPTTGPYTPEELERARTAVLGMVAPDQPPESFAPESLQQAAEAERQWERLRRDAWEQRHARDMEGALRSRPGGVALMVLGLGLMLIWSWAGWKLWRSPALARPRPAETGPA